MMTIIDAHCHFGKGDKLTHPANTSASLKKYLQRAEDAGISRTIVFPVLNHNYYKANAQIGKLVHRWPDKFIGFGFLQAKNDSSERKQIVKCIEQYGLKGIKVHKADGNINRTICEAASDIGIPIIYDVMGDIPHVELVAKEFPGVDFIIPHLGSFSDDWKAQSYLISLLERHKNVYADTSGVRRFDILEEAIKRGGSHKIIFGSDGPWLNPEVELYKIRALNLRSRDLTMILGQNILRLLSKVNSYS